ncbi:MAG: flagellar biosynthesis anti-sigma factor FlgM [Acidobacteria bacterium]|nr:flagellar biosynthesis anti-sigma factor FlgM [Acidobacteriota bacterium]
MKIDDSFAASNDVRSTQVGRTPEVEQQQKTRQQRTATQTDSASLSQLGTELARALENDSPDVVSKIEQLEKAVQSGTFKSSASSVAQSLIDDALQGTALDNESLSSLSVQTNT